MAAKISVESGAETRAIEFLAQSRFHQSFFLPATPKHGRLRVTYTVAGVDDADAPTLLFCGGMFGGRWTVVGIHHLAVKMGVRLVCCDRPGMGGSTTVSLEQRLPVWLETVPALLAHLKISHVSLGSHSAGTIFLFNTIATYPQFLHPKTPYAVLLAPWVHHSHSSVIIMKLSAMVPDTLVSNYWSSLCIGTAKIIQNTVNPAVASSSGAFGSLTALFKTDAMKGKSEREKAEVEAIFMEYFGMGVADKGVLDKLFLNYVFAEDTSGGNGEAMLCLKKGGADNWGVCEDYMAFVPHLAEVWKKALRTSEDGAAAREVVVEMTKPKLKIEAYFAEDDIMIGKGGAEYFNECFSNPACADILEYKSYTVGGTNHDTIVHPAFGPIASMLEEVKRRW